MIRVTGHAIQRLFERGWQSDLLDELRACPEPIEDALASRLHRGCIAAHKLGVTSFHITLGGLRVDEDSGTVLRADGSPIRGLHAAGRTALGIASNHYVSGLSLADCVWSGRRAGRIDTAA